jgi:hypothetical protein
MMLAHLSCARLVHGNIRTGVEYKPSQLRWSGANAAGDELEAPVCIVIDVGRTFTMSFNGNLYITGKRPGVKRDPAQYKTFTPMRLFQCAQRGRYGLRLLYCEWAERLECAE